MIKWIQEELEFVITVLAVSSDDDPVGVCRMGFEVGDTFTCDYGCPTGFCPKAMTQLHSLCEVVREGGDLRKFGGYARDGIRFTCVDGTVDFDLKAREKTE